MGDRADFIPSNNLLSAPLWYVIGLEQLRVSVCNVDGFVNISPRGTKRQRECELQKKKNALSVCSVQYVVKGTLCTANTIVGYGIKYQVQT